MKPPITEHGPLVRGDKHYSRRLFLRIAADQGRFGFLRAAALWFVIELVCALFMVPSDIDLVE